mgnify:CR=1 FL=1
MRSKLTGKIVEGNEDDIRAVHYLFALQPNEEFVDPPDEWSKRQENDHAEVDRDNGEAPDAEGKMSGSKSSEERPRSETDGKWQVTELAVRGMMTVY